MNIGFEYSGFETEEGETMTGAGEADLEEFIEFMKQYIEEWLRAGLKKNQNKMFSLVIITGDGEDDSIQCSAIHYGQGKRR